MTTLYQFLDIEPIRPKAIVQATQEASIPVRRPIHGIQLKESTYANLQILALEQDGSKRWVNVINSSAVPDASGVGKAQGTSNFFVAQVTHARDERIQLSQSFTKRYLRVFGSSPDFVEIAGALINAANFPWRSEWLKNYDQYFRASRTVEALARVYLTIDDTIYEGHMVRCRVVDQSENPNVSPMSFTMFLTNVIYAPVGGAKLYRKFVTSQTDIRASSVEYLKDAPANALGGPSGGTSEYEYDYYQDEFGNFRVRSNRPSSNDIAAQLYAEQVAALLDQKVMESSESLQDPSVFDVVKESLAKDFARVQQALMDALTNSETGYGLSKAEAAAANAVRLSRTTSGQDSSGQAEAIDSSYDECSAEYGPLCYDASQLGEETQSDDSSLLTDTGNTDAYHWSIPASLHLSGPVDYFPGI